MTQTTSEVSASCRAGLESLDDYRFNTLTVAINVVLARQGIKVCETEWGKALGKGLCEFRVRRALATICREAGIEVPVGVPRGGEVLLRTFFTVHGDRIVLLLGGYDKGADSSARRQQREIARARKFLDEFRRARQVCRKAACRGHNAARRRRR